MGRVDVQTAVQTAVISYMMGPLACTSFLSVSPYQLAPPLRSLACGCPQSPHHPLRDDAVLGEASRVALRPMSQFSRRLAMFPAVFLFFRDISSGSALSDSLLANNRKGLKLSLTGLVSGPCFVSCHDCLRFQDYNTTSKLSTLLTRFFY